MGMRLGKEWIMMVRGEILMGVYAPTTYTKLTGIRLVSSPLQGISFFGVSPHDALR